MNGPLPTDRLPGPSVRAIYVTKMAVMCSILVLMWAIRWFVFAGVPAEQYSLLILIVLLPTAAVVWWPGEVPVALLRLSFAADIAAVTVGIHFGGGVDNVSGPLLYFVLITLAGLVLSEQAAYVAAAASSLGYGVIVLAEHRGLLAHHVPYRKPPDDAAATVVVITVYLFLAAWVVSYAVRQIRAIYVRAEQLRREAVSALSHDLKTPLSVIRSCAPMISTASEEDGRDFTLRIERSAQQALDMVHNVLDASAIETRMIAPHKKQVDLNHLVADVVELYRAAALTKGVSLSKALAAGMPAVYLDEQLVGRAIGNLVSNAIKYTESQGEVEVRTEWENQAVGITVRDTGCGIATEEQLRIFEPYRRSTPSTSVEGTGLGLYIVRRVAEVHGGSVEVASRPGEGSAFTLSFPLD